MKKLFAALLCVACITSFNAQAAGKKKGEASGKKALLKELVEKREARKSARLEKGGHPKAGKQLRKEILEKRLELLKKKAAGHKKK